MSKKILVGFIVFILIWITVFAQINFLNSIPLFGVAANIGIVIITGIGLLSDKVPGGLAGAAYGILYDLLFGKCLGIYFAIYTTLGIASGKLSKGFSKENKLSMVYMVALFTIIAELFTYIAFAVIYGYSFEIFSAVWIVIKETIYNMLLAALLFRPLTFVSEIINKSKNSYYLL